MAKLSGMLKVEGTLDGYTIVKTQDGYIVRKKSSITGKRIKKDPAFAAFRRHHNEFGACTQAGKLLRDTLTPVLEDSIDNRVSSRLNKIMNAIKNEDKQSAAGKRTVAKGMETAAGRSLLKGFNFNIASQLNRVVLMRHRLNRGNTELRFENLDPDTHLQWPKGATHAVFQAGLACIDFHRKKGELIEDSVVVELKDKAKTLTLKLKNKSSLSPTKVLILKVCFLQELNGSQLALNEGRYNAVQVLEVWGG